MPVLFNSIGGADFFDLVGTVYPRQKQVELLERPGTDDYGARMMGTKGKPFKLVSVTYHDTFDTAVDALNEYVAMKGELRVLQMNSSIYGNVIIIDVAEAKPRQAVWNVAGAPGKQCRAEVAWTLVMVP